MENIKAKLSSSSNIIKMVINQPSFGGKRIVLIETKLLVVTTRLEYLINYLLALQESDIEGLIIYATKSLAILNGESDNEIRLSQYITTSIHFQKFLINIFRNSLCFIWDKVFGKYFEEMHFYETVEYDAPGCGFKRAFYCANGIEFYNHVVSIF